jgi:hypothetical protein
MAGATILGVVYGMNVGSDGASYFKVVDEAVRILSETANGSYIGMWRRLQLIIYQANGMWLVDVMPFCECRHV